MLVSYVPKKGEVVTLLSTMLDRKEFNESSGKPVVIMDYKKTGDGVDCVDQLFHTYSVQQITKCWPRAYVFNCLNLAAVNAQVAKFPAWEAHW